MKSTGTLNNYLTNNLLSSRPGSAGTPYTYPLDEVGGATAAYSMRKLSSTYSGPVIRVRRSSDNTEQDISFSGNDLDGASLSAFIGAGNGFVTTWYDQSGSGFNFTQTVAANQPAIVFNSTYNRYVIRYTATNKHFLSVGTLLSKPANFSSIATFSITSTSSLIYVLGASSSTDSSKWGGFILNRVLGTTLPAGDVSYFHSSSTDATFDSTNATFTPNVLGVATTVYTTGVRTQKLRKNGVVASLLDINGNAVTNDGTICNFSIGRGGDLDAHYLDGDLPEFITINIAWTDTEVKIIEDSARDYFGF